MTFRPESSLRRLTSLLLPASLALGACGGAEGADEPLAAEPAPDPTSTAEPTSTRAPGGADDEAPPPSREEGSPAVAELDPGLEPALDPEQAGASDEAEPPAEPGTELEVPDTDHCAAVDGWDPEWSQFEDEVLELVNAFRAAPADCGVEGAFQPAAPLAMDPVLRCSARLHSADMFERGFFAHESPEGVDPAQRMQAAGFGGRLYGENIAQGQPTPQAVMEAWMASDGHCANIMRPEYTLIGIGYEPGAQMRGGSSNYWTQNFGAPGFMRGGAGQR